MSYTASRSLHAPPWSNCSASLRQKPCGIHHYKFDIRTSETSGPAWHDNADGPLQKCGERRAAATPKCFRNRKKCAPSRKIRGARQNLRLRPRPHSRPHGLLGSEDDLRGDLLAVVRHGVGLGPLLDLATHEARDLAQLRQAIGAPRDGALGLAGAAQRVADDFLGVVAAEDLDQVILHAEGEGIVSQIGNLIRALVAEEGSVGQGEVLNVHWRGDDAARDVQTLADMALHLRAEDGRGLKSRDHVRDLGVVVGDEGLVAEAGDLLAEPLLIVLAEGARAHDLDAHLPRQHPGHAGRVRGVAEDHGPLVGQVLAVDGPGEPSSLRHEACLLVDVLFEIKAVVALRLADLCQLPHEFGGLTDAERGRVHNRHVVLLLQVLGGHVSDLAVGHDVEPRPAHLVEIVDTRPLGNHNVRLDAHVAQHALQLAAVVRVVEAQREGADDIGRWFLGLLHRHAGILCLFHVELDDLRQGPVRCLVLVEAIVVHIGEQHVAGGRLRSALDKVPQILLQDAAGTRWREHDQVGLVVPIFACDVVDDLLPRATRQDMAVDDARRHGREVALALEHAAHNVEVVVAQRRMHDGVHILEG
mmetsp:Transcript_134970/g.430963  ORF Transcript_134970/g.430963 Transcript_134970/m.430963 type:complete len:587 (-) Transcript_134970:579-2339(-)